MSLSFNPPLAQLTPLHIPLHPVDLVFSAKLSNHEEYRTTKESGVRVEIWSDIPKPGIGDGQWNALAFEWSQTTESLVLKIPSAVFVHPWRTQFSFTYRLIYPNGLIKWLGSYGYNGTLLVQKDDERFELCSGWHVDRAALVFSPNEHNHPMQVARLSDKVEWSLWAFGSELVPHLLALGDELPISDSALIIPRQSHSAIVPFAPILLTSSDASFSIKRSGIIVMEGASSGTLCLQTLSPADLADHIGSFSGSVSIDCDSPHHALILTPPSKPLNLDTAYLSIVSLVPSLTQLRQFSVSLSRITSNLPFQTSELALSSDWSDEARFVSVAEDTFTIASGLGGGSQWLFSPVHELASSDRIVRVAVLAPHTRVVAPIHTHRLPTPPPSPVRLYAQIQPTQSFDEDVATPEPDMVKKEPKATGIVARPLTRSQVPRSPTLTWRLIKLIIRLVSWSLMTLLQRLFVFKSLRSTQARNVAASGSFTPAREQSSTSGSSTVTGTATPTTLGGERLGTVLGSPAAGRDLDDKLRMNGASEDAAEQNVEDIHQSPPLTFDITLEEKHIRLLAKGKEEDVMDLKFTVGGEENKLVSIAKAVGNEDDTWLVELAEGSGRLEIHL